MKEFTIPNNIKKDYRLVKSLDKLPELYSYIDKYDYHAFDVEATGLNTRKDKVIGFSICGEYGKAYYISILEWDKEQQKLVRNLPEEVAVGILNKLKTKDLLMWNALYDVSIVQFNLGVELINALVSDVMLQKHTLQEDGTFRLKEVAVELQDKLGYSVEEQANEEQVILKENVAANGGSTTKNNYEMYKADLSVMYPYACMDVDLTIRLGDYFYNKLDDEGLCDFFFDIEVMPLLKEVTYYMVTKPIKIDMELLHETNDNIIKDLEMLEKDVRETILATKEGKRWAKEYIETTYPVSNRGKFVQAVCEYYQLPLPKTKSGSYSVSKSNVDKLPDSTVKSFIQTGQGFVAKDIKKIRELLIEKNNDPILNIGSKKQLSEIVFDKLKIKALSKTDKGSPQFNDTLIDHLVKEYNFEWAKKLSNYNKLSKIKSSYIDRYLELNEDGYFYPSFFQHRTISGRYGSDMQQLPRPKGDSELPEIVLKYNNIIRKFFISGDDRRFIDNDYESLEPHVFAHVSGDEGLRDIFRKGHDFYSTIAITTEKLEGVSADKTADNYLGKVNKPLRQKCKAYSLGIPYGMSAFALGKTLDISTKEAEALVDGYLNGFPNLKKWMKDSEYMAKTKGYVKSEAGRIRHLPKVKEIYSIHRDKLLDFKYRKKLESRIGKDRTLNMYRDYKNGINNAKNVQIQSLSASIVNLSAIEINRELRRRGIDGWVCLQIHDQLVVNVPKDRAEECRDLVQSIMENNYKLSLKLKAPAEIGINLYEAH